MNIRSIKKVIPQKDNEEKKIKFVFFSKLTIIRLEIDG